MNVPDFIGQDYKIRQIRHANEFWDHYGVYVDDELKSPGDLIFFSRHGTFPTHIGIVRDDESYIHAPGVNNTKVEIGRIAFEVINSDAESRILYQSNPIGYKAPTIGLDIANNRYHQRLL